MLFTQNFNLLWIILINICIINTTRSENFNYKTKLHNLMNNNELDYYFKINNNKNLNENLPKYEIVHLNRNLLRRKRSFPGNFNESENMHKNEAEEHHIGFNVFNRSISLKLRANPNLISPYIQTFRTTELNEREPLNFKHRNCHFLHKDAETVAGISNCHEDDKYNGIILTPKQTLEIQPVSSRLKKILTEKNANENFDSVHLVKIVEPPEIVPNLKRPKREILENEDSLLNYTNLQSRENGIEGRIIRKNAKLTVELGLFFDETAYKLFSPYFNKDDRKLAELVLTYMNGVQALYHHHSLGVPIDIIIVYIQIMRKQPTTFPTYRGERDKLLDSFCAYQKRLNSPSDTDPNHWDMALLVSGLDFFAIENGQHSGSTMGLATVRGVCTKTYDCVIAEFGVTNAFGRPYPSAGFNSVYVAAHEIGHNLGMSHDSSGNHCSREGYIMSPSRGTQGETTWSTCSADVVRNLQSWATCLNDKPVRVKEQYDAWRNQGYPGAKWPPKKQCELLLIDKDATHAENYNSESMCQNLQCRTPHRTGYFFAGPALEGTDCAAGKWCEGGNCIAKRRIPQIGPVTKGGWSQWKRENCRSGCTVNSRGFQIRRRDCNNPVPVNTNEGCEGSSYEVDLCNDARICRNIKRKSLVQYASRKCKQYSEKISDLDKTGVGLQAPYEANRLWTSCAIFCRQTDGSFYTPKMELNDLRLDAYFPDGTWCHNDDTQNFFCHQHHCLPENFQFNKFNFWALSEDVPISGNANPNPRKKHNKRLMDYLTLDRNGKPIRTHLARQDVAEFNIDKENWIEDRDFRVVPSLFKQPNYRDFY